MLPMLGGNSEIGAHVRTNICYLICQRHLIRSRAVTNRIFFSSKRPIFLQRVLSYLLMQVSAPNEQNVFFLLQILFIL